MKRPKQSRHKVLAGIAGIFAAIIITLGVVGTWVTYPTSEHRDVSRQTYEIIEKNGGAFSFNAYDTPEYNELAKSPEATYAGNAQLIVTLVEMVITIYVIGRIYKYIRKNNLSPSKRSVGLTAALTAAGNIVAYVVLLYPTSFFTGIPVVYDAVFLFGLIGVGIITFIVGFIVASLFEIVYNKKHSFVVE